MAEQRQATGYQAQETLPYVLRSHESELQTLVLAGIQVILLVRLAALVSNRPSAEDLPSIKYTLSLFMGSGARQHMTYCW